MEKKEIRELRDDLKRLKQKLTDENQTLKLEQKTLKERMTRMERLFADYSNQTTKKIELLTRENTDLKGKLDRE